MSDPVLTFILLACFFAVMAAARFFKTIDRGFAQAAQTPVTAGVISGVVLLFALRLSAIQPLLAGLVMTFAAVFVRHTGDESEAADGMILGSLTGVAAAIPLAIFAGASELRLFAQLVLAGSVAGYGITYAAFHVADRTRQLVTDAVTGIAAIVVAYVPTVIDRRIVSDRDLAITAAAAIPLITIGIVFKQWPDVRAELAHESALGFVRDEDVATTAHPLRRLGRGGWMDAGAHREFVRLASKIALRKRQQRNRGDEMARLYQLEIIKLRMQLQEMAKIDQAARSAAADAAAADHSSDKMRA